MTPTTNPAADAALSFALKQIEGLHQTYNANRAREAADPRFTALRAYSEKLRPEHALSVHGLFDHITDANTWRSRRAMHLATARHFQLRGYHEAAQEWLRKAAFTRKTEVANRPQALAYSASEIAADRHYDMRVEA